jgi:hypothetical protein
MWRKNDMIENNSLKTITDKFFLEFKNNLSPRCILKLSYNEDFFPSSQSENSAVEYNLILATLYPSEIEIDNPDDENIDIFRIKEDEKINGVLGDSVDISLCMPHINEFNSLHKEGYGLLFVPLFSRNISEYLNKKGLYIKAILKLPELSVPVKKRFVISMEGDFSEDIVGLYNDIGDSIDEEGSLNEYSPAREELDSDYSKFLKENYERRFGCEVKVEKDRDEYEIEYTGLLNPEPYLLIVKKEKSEKIFFSELDSESDNGLIIKRFLSGGGLDIKEGIWINYFEDIFDFIYGPIENDPEEIIRFLDKNKKFKEYFASDLFVNKNEDLSAFNIYDFRDNVSKEEYKILINSKIVLPLYLKYYFKSPIGEKIIDNIISQIFPLEHFIDTSIINFIEPEIIMSNIFKLNPSIPLPSIQDQKYFIEDIEKLERAKDSVKDIEKEFYIIPIRINEISERLYDVLDSFKRLTEADKIKFLCKRGETIEVEFKKTISARDFVQPEKRGIKPIVKSINAFLNTPLRKNGTILVGIDDNGDILGVNHTDPKYYSDDKYLQILSSLINDYIGKEYIPLIDFNMIEIDGKKILKIKITPNEGIICIKKYDDESYMRVGPESRLIKRNEIIKINEKLKRLSLRKNENG